MTVAGHNSLLTCATGASATYVSINGIKSYKIGDSRDQLDITDFADGNVHARLAALRDVKLDISGDYEPTDSTGWGKLQAAYNAGDDIAVQVFTSAVATTSGFCYLMKVGSIDINASADGKAEVSVSLMINASSGTAIFVL
jgi:predicted secreted protein